MQDDDLAHWTKVPSSQSATMGPSNLDQEVHQDILEGARYRTGPVPSID